MDRHSLWDIPEEGYRLGLLSMHISLMRDVVLSTATAAVRGCNLEDRGEGCLGESVVHRMEGLVFTGTFKVTRVATGNIQALYLYNMVLHQPEDIVHKGTRHVLVVHLQIVILRSLNH